MDWLTGWQYRKSITISQVSGAVINNRMKLSAGEPFWGSWGSEESSSGGMTYVAWIN